MRYYAVLGAKNAPHVIAEFARRSEAQEFDVVDSYSEAEMQQDPLLIAALERWRDGVEMPYTRWEGPRPEMERAREQRAKALRTEEAENLAGAEA